MIKELEALRERHYRLLESDGSYDWVFFRLFEKTVDPEKVEFKPFMAQLEKELIELKKEKEIKADVSKKAEKKEIIETLDSCERQLEALAVKIQKLKTKIGVF